MPDSKNKRSTMVMFRCPNDLLRVVDAIRAENEIARSALIIEALRQMTGTPRPVLKMKIAEKTT